MIAQTEPEVLHSAIDSSVNFVWRDGRRTVEARYVRRADDYFIVYLSSQAGCRMGCAFCHLTATGQTFDEDVSFDGIVDQATRVLGHYDQGTRNARKVNFNFMARGEVLGSKVILARADELIDALGSLAVDRGLVPVFKFSTIMPRLTMVGRELTDVFRRTQPDIYYSLYSVDPGFRRQWMPAAMGPHAALAKLARWQQVTHKIPVLHWAFIEGQNDSEESMEQVAKAVNAADLRADFNIVRYNPFSAEEGREPSEWVIGRNAEILRSEVPGSRVQVVPKVGFDVKASCGMFVRAELPSLASISVNHYGLGDRDD